MDAVSHALLLVWQSSLEAVAPTSTMSCNSLTVKRPCPWHTHDREPLMDLCHAARTSRYTVPASAGFELGHALCMGMYAYRHNSCKSSYIMCSPCQPALHGTFPFLSPCTSVADSTSLCALARTQTHHTRKDSPWLLTGTPNLQISSLYSATLTEAAGNPLPAAHA